MKNPDDLRSLTIYQFLESFIGKEKTRELINTMQNAIDKNISGEALRKLISEEITRLKITDHCAQELILYIPYVILKNEPEK